MNMETDKDYQKRITELSKQFKQLLSERQGLVDMRDAEKISRAAALWEIPAGDENPLLKNFIAGRVKAAEEAVRAVVRLNYVRENNLSKKQAARLGADEKFQELFETELSESERYRRIRDVSRADELSSEDQDLFRKVLARADLTADYTEKLRENSSRIKKTAAEVFDAADIRAKIMSGEDDYLKELEENVEKSLLQFGKAFYHGRPLSTRNISAFLDDFIAPDGYIFQRNTKQAFGPNGKTAFFETVMKKTVDPITRKTVWMIFNSDRACRPAKLREMYKKAFNVDDLASDAIGKVRMRFPRERVLSSLAENPLYAELIKKKKAVEERRMRIKNGLLEAIPQTYPELFPLARSMFRHFIMHIGPTNSGKSYDAIEALKKAGTGIYLAPLRLLAYEKYEELNFAGARCSLKTGEEEIKVPGASIQSSTIEMLDFTRQYDIAVIDEGQLIADPQRGSAWTMAILGVQAATVHICLAPEAEEAVTDIIRACDDTFEKVYHKRLVPLEYEADPPIDFPHRAERGTAFIVFSRKDVHAVAGELQRQGYSCSVIYGALPYDVRRNEVKRYISGDTDIVVATGAIGMGLNLPIERIMFLRTEKFDGEETRPLKASEIKQIAGRAGRYGMFDRGYVCTIEDDGFVRMALRADVPPVKEARIGFPYSMIGIEGRTSELMRRWCEIEPKPGFEIADMTREIDLAEELEKKTDNKDLVYKFVMFPFDEKSPVLKEIWLDLFETERMGVAGNCLKHLPPRPKEGFPLDLLELQFRVCDLLYHYASTFMPNDAATLGTISKRKNMISDMIMQKLSKEKLSLRSCRICGRPMPFVQKGGICQICYKKRRPVQEAWK